MYVWIQTYTRIYRIIYMCMGGGLYMKYKRQILECQYYLHLGKISVDFYFFFYILHIFRIECLYLISVMRKRKVIKN